MDVVLSNLGPERDFPERDFLKLLCAETDLKFFSEEKKAAEECAAAAVKAADDCAADLKLLSEEKKAAEECAEAAVKAADDCAADLKLLSEETEEEKKADVVCAAAAAVKAADDCAADLKLLSEETEEEKKAADECVAAAAVKAADDCAADLKLLSGETEEEKKADEVCAAAAAVKAADDCAADLKLLSEETEEETEEEKNADEVCAAAAAVKAADDCAADLKLLSEETEEETEEEKKAAEECAAAAVKAFDDCVADLKLLSEETEEEKKAAEDCAAAAKASGESATSKVEHEGVRQPYPCLCYPKELLKKEEEQYGLHNEEVLLNVFKLWAIKQRYNKDLLPPFIGDDDQAIFQRCVKEVELRDMFNDWATKNKKKYDDVYEWRLRYTIWLNTKVREEQLCSLSGRTFSMDEMYMDADLTGIEDDLGNRGIVKPGVRSLSDVKIGVLVMMGESWIKKTGVGFYQWAKRHKKAYSSTEEEEKRLLAYLDNMRIIHLWERDYPGEWGYGNDLKNMDQFMWEKDLIPPVKCSRCRPRKKHSSTPPQQPRKKRSSKAAPFLQKK